MAENVEYVLSLRDLFSSKLNSAISGTDKLDSKMKQTTSTASSMGGALAKAFAFIGGAALGMDVINTTAKLEGLRNQLNFTSGSATKGAEEWNYLKDISNALGMELTSTGKAYTGLSAAARGTSLEGDQVKNIFESVSMASTVMHLSADETSGALLSLQQMMSKGKVQAEELRGQLGERLPGAFQIAARSMGMTTMQLDKFMSEGKLMSDTFLPRFANQLKTEFAGGLNDATNSLAANTNRIKNEFTLVKDEFGTAFYPMIVKGMVVIREVFSSFGSVIGIFKENWESLKYVFEPSIRNMSFAIDYIKEIGNAFTWTGEQGGVFNSMLNAAGVIMRVLEPFARVLTIVAGETVKVVISLVTGIADLIVGLGKLFGYSEKKFNLSTPEKKESSFASAMGINTKYGAGAFSSGSGTGKKAGSLSSNVDAVSGSKPTSIVIHIGKLVENQNFDAGATSNIKGIAPKIKEEMIKVFLQMMNDSQQLMAI